MLDAARLTQVIIDPMNPLAYKQEKEMRVSRHRGDATNRQFGSMRGRSSTIAAMC